MRRLILFAVSFATMLALIPSAFAAPIGTAEDSATQSGYITGAGIETQGETAYSTVPAGRPVFSKLNPEPYSTNEPSRVVLRATAQSDSPIKQFRLLLNGDPLLPALEAGPLGSITGSYNIDLVNNRVYTATAIAVDTEGDEFRTQWDFVMSHADGDSVWFTEAGLPKANQINATMRSLVEAFRWHLYGLSWDGANHPELPNHVGLKGQAGPLETWVTGTTFNRAATEATLRSLVEAFRWHFWGVSWDNRAHCDIPTHIASCNQYLPAQGLDPWFNAGGQPIRANIEATLRSLVEAFRWHFWGYSWDGQYHFEIPTHAYQ